MSRASKAASISLLAPFDHAAAVGTTLELQKLIGLAQLIVDIERELFANPSPAMATFYDSLVNQTLAVELKEGRVCISAKPRGLKTYDNNGFSSSPRLGDFRHLVQK